MATSIIPLTSFQGGKLDDEFVVNSDLDQFARGLSKADNVYITAQGKIRTVAWHANAWNTLGTGVTIVHSICFHPTSSPRPYIAITQSDGRIVLRDLEQDVFQNFDKYLKTNTTIYSITPVNDTLLFATSEGDFVLAYQPLGSQTGFPFRELVNPQWAIPNIEIDFPGANQTLHAFRYFYVVSPVINGIEYPYWGLNYSNRINISAEQGANKFDWTLTGSQVDEIEYYKIYRANISSDTIPTWGSQVGFIGQTIKREFTDNNIAPDFSRQPPTYFNPFLPNPIIEIGINVNDTQALADARTSTQRATFEESKAAGLRHVRSLTGVIAREIEGAAIPSQYFIHWHSSLPGLASRKIGGLETDVFDVAAIDAFQYSVFSNQPVAEREDGLGVFNVTEFSAAIGASNGNGNARSVNTVVFDFGLGRDLIPESDFRLRRRSNITSSSSWTTLQSSHASVTVETVLRTNSHTGVTSPHVYKATITSTYTGGFGGFSPNQPAFTYRVEVDPTGHISPRAAVVYNNRLIRGGAEGNLQSDIWGSNVANFYLHEASPITGAADAFNYTLNEGRQIYFLLHYREGVLVFAAEGIFFMSGERGAPLSATSINIRKFDDFEIDDRLAPLIVQDGVIYKSKTRAHFFYAKYDTFTGEFKRQRINLFYEDDILIDTDHTDAAHRVHYSWSWSAELDLLALTADTQVHICSIDVEANVFAWTQLTTEISGRDRDDLNLILTACWVGDALYLANSINNTWCFFEDSPRRNHNEPNWFLPATGHSFSLLPPADIRQGDINLKTSTRKMTIFATPGVEFEWSLTLNDGTLGAATPVTIPAGRKSSTIPLGAGYDYRSQINISVAPTVPFFQIDAIVLEVDYGNRRE